MTSNVFAEVRKARFGLMLLAALCVTVLTASPAKANTAITGPCPVVITQPGDYFLSTNLTCPPNVDGIDIEASQVTLSLSHHKINGTCGTGYGIHVLGTPPPAAPLTGVYILGPGTIDNFSFNFVADYSADSFVNFVTVDSQCPSNYGFLINTTSNQWGLVKDVVVAPETSYGINLFGPDNVAALCNVDDTINISSNNILVDNAANDNLGGIFVFGSNNQVYANTTNNNTAGDGILVLSGALGNTFSGNKASGNLPWDMEDDNPTCGTNIWLGDTFGSANQGCIH